MNIIYIDVLIVLNIYVTYFLIKSTSRIAHATTDTFKIVVASAVGSLFSLLVLVPEINFVIMFLLKSLVSFLIVMIAFGKMKFSEYLRLTLYFYIINFLFAGIILGLKYFLIPEHITICNSYFYVDISLISLVIFTAAAYFIICIIRILFDRGNNVSGEYNVIIRVDESIVSVEGLADTGNTLIDLFSGKPVIVCSVAVAEKLSGKKYFGGDIYDFLATSEKINGLRFVPYSTIDGRGVLSVFNPDEVIIRHENVVRKVDALIGVKESKDCAVFNPSILV